MKVPQIKHGVMLNGKEITTPLGIPRNPPAKAQEPDVIEITNPDLLLDPSKKGYIIEVK